MCLSEAAVRRAVQFGEAEQLDAAEGELPAAHVFLHVVHPAAFPAYTTIPQKNTHPTGRASSVANNQITRTQFKRRDVTTRSKLFVRIKHRNEGINVLFIISYDFILKPQALSCHVKFETYLIPKCSSN